MSGALKWCLMKGALEQVTRVYSGVRVVCPQIRTLLSFEYTVVSRCLQLLVGVG